MMNLTLPAASSLSSSSSGLSPRPSPRVPPSPRVCINDLVSYPELVTPSLVQRKDELQWVGWVAELVKKKAEERVVAVGKWRVYFFSFTKGTAKVCVLCCAVLCQPPSPSRLARLLARWTAN
jgi:hypothetical protein